MVSLSEATARRIEVLFRDRAAAGALLERECADNLPWCEKAGPVELERIRFAALKLSGGNLERLREAVSLAKTDWRDLLVAAEFAHDVTAHLKWEPQPEN